MIVDDASVVLDILLRSTDAALLEDRVLGPCEVVNAPHIVTALDIDGANDRGADVSGRQPTVAGVELVGEGHDQLRAVARPAQPSGIESGIQGEHNRRLTAVAIGNDQSGGDGLSTTRHIGPEQ